MANELDEIAGVTKAELKLLKKRKRKKKKIRKTRK
jgi:hypothetical protein